MGGLLALALAAGLAVLLVVRSQRKTSGLIVGYWPHAAHWVQPSCVYLPVCIGAMLVVVIHMLCIVNAWLCCLGLAAASRACISMLQPR